MTTSHATAHKLEALRVSDERQALRELGDRVCPIDVPYARFLWRVEYEGHRNNGLVTWRDVESGETITLDSLDVDYAERLAKWKQECEARS
jgi:hypothetical protein